MIKNKTFKTFYLAAFLIIQAVLGYFVQTTSGKLCSSISLSIIILSLLTIIIFYKRDTLHFLTLIAYINTLCADFFLCGLVDFENIKVVAMVFFSITQIFYFLRLYSNHLYTSEKRIHLIVRILLTVIVLTVTFIVLGKNNNLLAVISMFYFTNLFINLIYAFIQIKRAPLFAIGLLLFAFCDTVIGFSFLPSFLSVPKGSFIDIVNNADINLAWLFYTPSQTLIAFDSAIKKD